MKYLFQTFTQFWVYAPSLAVAALMYQYPSLPHQQVLINYTSHEAVSLQAVVFTVCTLASVNLFGNLMRLQAHLLRTEFESTEVTKMIRDLGKTIKSSVLALAILLILTACLVIARDQNLLGLNLLPFCVTGVIITTYVHFYIIYDLTIAELEISNVFSL